VGGAGGGQGGWVRDVEVECIDAAVRHVREAEWLFVDRSEVAVRAGPSARANSVGSRRMGEAFLVDSHHASAQV